MEHGTEPKYIPVKFTKDGGLNGENLATLEQFGKLAGHITKTLADIAGELKSGSIEADPYYRSQADNACIYCEYFEACRFDPERDRPRYCTKLKTPEVWQLMEKEETKCRK
jgi:ATP-dependent helicase/nuclease subunit B